jgi:hypothetical protein
VVSFIYKQTGGFMKVYSYKEVESLKNSDLVSAARTLWQAKSSEYYNKHGDTGSCIMGDGIYILFKPKRCRIPQKFMLIPSNQVARCQGSLHYEHSKDEVISFLRDNGVDCSYNYGMMD